MSVPHLCLDLLHQIGAQFVGIAPGSRSSVLVEAVVPDERFTLNRHFDERSLGFWALGIGKASQKPAVVICTSGTAVANLLPAVVEAAEAKVPMILLTADRQEQDKYCAANQTIQSQQLPLAYLNAYVDINYDNNELEDVEKCINKAFNTLSDSDPGPIQINLGLPDPNRVTQRPKTTKKPSLSFGTREKLALSSDLEWQKAKDRIESAQNGCIVVGEWRDFETVMAVAEAWNWPVLVDIQSQGRLREHPLVVNAVEDVLRTEPNVLDHDVVLWVGQRLVSKYMVDWLKDRDVVQVSLHRECVDAGVGGRVQRLVVASSASALPRVAEWRPDAPPPYKAQPNKSALTRLKAELNTPSKPLSEPQICTHIPNTIPNTHPCLIGNSLPIRNCNRYWLTDPNNHPTVYANRGASGIDGLIATAVGIAQASGKLTTLIIGDTSALYDINALFMVRNAPVPVHIWLINNNGGGIFRQLPVGKTDLCELYFAQPNHANFKAAAEMANVSYQRIETQDQLLGSKRNPHQSILIECQVG